MVKLKSPPLLPIILLFYIQTHVQSSDFFTANCTDSPDYTQNSQYQRNLQNLLSTLPTHASTAGFYNTSLGQNPAQVFALYLCRADVSSRLCNECVLNCTGQILTQCPLKMKAVIWRDECMLRYTNEPVFQKMADEPSIRAPSDNNIPKNETQLFVQVLDKTMDELVVRVANSELKFNTEMSKVTSSEYLYTLGQCTPDLSESDCNRCLRVAVGQLQLQLGARVLLPSCNVRFEVSSFYGDTVNSSFLLSANNSSTVTRPSEKRRDIAIAVTVSLVLAAVLLLCGVCFCFYNKKGQQPSPELGGMMTTAESLQFDFNTIRAATDNFSLDNKLGQGGFGAVYKGRLQNGQVIAVKRLSMDSGQGIKEFKTEVLLVARLQHNNLVRLLGFCLHKKEKLLMYEFLPNASLDKVLLDHNNHFPLDWETRYKIIAGIARGLLYLHEDSRLRIIHRDLKSSNILLDESMNPKISDFGLAKLVGVDQTQVDTNRIVGTYGYMAPEYAMNGRFSVKSDVYSFGVIILEIVSGHKCNSTVFPYHEEDLKERAWRLWNNDQALELVDIRLGGNYSSNEVMRCIHIGLLCIQEVADRRPTMAPIVSALNGHPVDLAAPTPTLATTSGDGSGVSSSTTFSGNKDITDIYSR